MDELGMVVHICDPSYSRGEDREDQVWGQPGKKLDPISTNKPDSGVCM
jgi:hypothetical protein